MRILVVDDERVLVKGIKFNLEHEGYEVECCYDGATAVELVRSAAFDLVVMDLMLPVIDGLEACRRIREFSAIPVVMLTARGEDTDKLIGFEYGADDYITKPFNILELKARIRVILRRASSFSESSSEPLLECAHIRLDSARRIAYADNSPVELTAKEFDLVHHLMRHPGRVFSREMLLNTIWGYEFPGDIRTVDVHVRRLREKLEKNPSNPEIILTKWSVGYYCKA